MQDAPDKATLLGALAQFLAEQVQPTIDDRGLAFRVRIAAHLAATLAREVEHQDAHDAAELERLQALLGDESQPRTDSERRALITALNGRLAQAIRAGQVEAEAARGPLMTTLREKLAVVQPRFDTTLELPESE